MLRVNEWSNDVSVCHFVFIHQDKWLLIVDDVENEFFTGNDSDEVGDILSVDSETYCWTFGDSRDIGSTCSLVGLSG